MSTIAQQLAELATIKEAIRQAVIAKGVTVASDAAFDTYATAIGQISGGGGSDDDFIAMIERSIVNLIVPSGTTEIGYQSFSQCTKMITAIIPDSVETIGGYAFNNCNKMETIIIGSGCTTFAASAFSACKALSTIIIKASTPPDTSANTFGTANSNYVGRDNYDKGTNKLYVPYGKSSAYSSSGSFSSVLLDATKCGFSIVELDSNGNIPT